MKIFKNRMTHEDEAIIRMLRSTDIKMNIGKKTTPDTPEGLFFISLQPNSKVDEIKLESDFNFILCLYYRWRYGSKWTHLKNLQHKFNGIIEKQQGNHYHIHFILMEQNIEEVAMFLGYIKAVFKQLYPKATFNFQRVYDLKHCGIYTAPENKNKGRVAPAIVIGNNLSVYA